MSKLLHATHRLACFDNNWFFKLPIGGETVSCRHKKEPYFEVGKIVKVGNEYRYTVFKNKDGDDFDEPEIGFAPSKKTALCIVGKIVLG